MTEFRYDPKSLRADEFINDAEILDSIAYADAHKDDIELCRHILDKARANLHPSADHGAVITHREASVLLACEDPQINREIKELAHQIKLAYYGNRIVLFAPLYLSNYCVNGCLYCPYHAKNRTIPAGSSLRKRSAMRLLPCKIWVISAWPSKQAKIRSTTPSNTSWSRCAPSIP